MLYQLSYASESSTYGRFRSTDFAVCGDFCGDPTGELPRLHGIDRLSTSLRADVRITPEHCSTHVSHYIEHRCFRHSASANLVQKVCLRSCNLQLTPAFVRTLSQAVFSDVTGRRGLTRARRLLDGNTYQLGCKGPSLLSHQAAC